MPQPMAARSSRELNRPRFQPGQSGHLESYFVKGNDPRTRRAYWLKFTVFAPNGDPAEAVGEAWVVLFDPEAGWVKGAKQEVPVTSCTFASEPYVEVAGCELRQDGSKGSLTAGDGTEIAWDLEWDATSTPLVPYPWEWMYRRKIPKTKTVTPHPDARHSGEVRCGDERWAVDRIPGMQGHNWGTEHAHRYAWMHCNAFWDRPGAVFEGFSARIKVGPWLTPPISGGFLWLPDGTRHVFNKVRSMRTAKVAIEHTEYRFAYENDSHRLEGEARVPAELMAGLYYRNPDRSISHCLNSKTADLSLRLSTLDGAEVERLEAPQGAALETLTKDTDHPVSMIL